MGSPSCGHLWIALSTSDPSSQMTRALVDCSVAIWRFRSQCRKVIFSVFTVEDCSYTEVECPDHLLRETLLVRIACGLILVLRIARPKTLQQMTGFHRFTVFSTSTTVRRVAINISLEVVFLNIRTGTRAYSSTGTEADLPTKWR
jgi:hypothetical protein